MSELPTHENSAAATPPAVPAWRQWASLAGAVALGAVLLVAGLAKGLDPASFATQIRHEGLEILLPAAGVALIALALEFFLGIALMLGVRRPWLLWATTALVAFFVFLTGRAYWRHLQGEAPPAEGCGCFGNLVERTPAEAFWQDVLMLVPALALAWLAFSPGRGMRRLVVAAVATVVLTLASWRSPHIAALDDLATSLKPGAAVAELCAGKAEDGTRTCLDAIVPELREGEHLVLMAELDDEKLAASIPALNEFAWDQSVPKLWMLSGATDADLFNFRFQRGPTFEIREAPAGLLKTLYRQLPRSFRVENGRIAETWRDLPPLERWKIPLEPNSESQSSKAEP